AISSAAQAEALGPWTLGPSTNGGFAHNGVAGVPGHLYEATNIGAVEVAAILPDGSLGAWSVTSALNAARSFAITATAGAHIDIAGGWVGACCRSPDNNAV